MYIARSVSLGRLLTESDYHTEFIPMPRLKGKALELYIAAWGDETYQRYCDADGLTHGAHPPDAQAAREIRKRDEDIPSIYRPEHDVESAFWSFFVTTLQLVPIGAGADERSRRFHNIWRVLLEHEACSELDERDNMILDVMTGQGPRYFKGVLHPQLEPVLARLLWQLAQQITPEYALLSQSIAPDHLHEAVRRILLQFMVDMEDEILLDVRRGRRGPRTASPTTGSK